MSSYLIIEIGVENHEEKEKESSESIGIPIPQQNTLKHNDNKTKQNMSWLILNLLTIEIIPPQPYQ